MHTTAPFHSHKFKVESKHIEVYWKAFHTVTIQQSVYSYLQTFSSKKHCRAAFTGSAQMSKTMFVQVGFFTLLRNAYTNRTVMTIHSMFLACVN